jgi:hypothetical protein
MEEFRKQLKRGSIQKAYKALLSYMMALRTHFKNNYPEAAVSGLYQGYLDMTYFALFPLSLKPRGLKIAIVFNYDAFRFEGWLAGSNRKIQRDYWEQFRNGRWANYRVVTPASGRDAIIECDLTGDGDFDFSDPNALTSTIETAVAAFIADVETFLSEHQPGETAGVRLHHKKRSSK